MYRCFRPQSIMPYDYVHVTFIPELHLVCVYNWEFREISLSRHVYGCFLWRSGLFIRHSLIRIVMSRSTSLLPQIVVGFHGLKLFIFNDVFIWRLLSSYNIMYLLTIHFVMMMLSCMLNSTLAVANKYDPS